MRFSKKQTHKINYIFLACICLLTIFNFTACSNENAVTPYSSANCIGKAYTDIESDFSVAGFSNISIEVIEDLEISEQDKIGTVQTISINGIAEFDSNAEFATTSNVVITYHTLKTIYAPVSFDQAIDMDTEALIKSFTDAGFINITTDEIIDLDPDKTNAEFENRLTINQETSFDTNAKFPIDSEVKIITHRPYKKYNLKVIVDFSSNLLFNKYDIVFLVAENSETLNHGQDGEFEYRLKSGNYTMAFHRVDDSSIVGDVEVDLSGDTEISLKISCHSERIDVEAIYLENQGAIGENEAMIPLSGANCKYKNYKDVEKLFANAGFTNITAEILYDIFWGITDEGEVERVSINGKTDFVRGDVFEKNASVVITYHMKEEDDPNNQKQETETTQNISTETTTTESSSVEIETTVSEITTETTVVETTITETTSSTTVQPTQTEATQKQERMVWIPESGSKYHSNAGCSNMKNPTQVTISKAQSMGYEACKRCN